MIKHWITDSDKKLILKKLRNFFSKNYRVAKIWLGGRHILGYLEKGSKKLFLKLATSEGISAVAENEFRWNELFNTHARTSRFFVPKNYTFGFYQNLFYYICKKFEGKLIVNGPKAGQSINTLVENLELIIAFSELIQSLKLKPFNPFFDSFNFRDHFVNKSNGWLQAIPKVVAEKYKLQDLQEIVKKVQNHFRQNLVTEILHPDIFSCLKIVNWV